MSKLVPNADVVVNGRSRRQIQEQQQMEIARQQAQQPSIKVTHNNYAKPAPVQPIYEYETYEEEYEEEEEEQRIARAIDEGISLAISSSSIVLFDCLVRRRSFVIMDDSFSFIRQLRYLFFFACS